MSDTVEGLAIEIEVNTGGAVNQLEAMNKKLEVLQKNLKGSSAMKAFGKNYKELINSVNESQIYSSKVNNIISLSNAMQGLNKVKVSPTISKTLDDLGFTLMNINKESLMYLTELGTGLYNLSTVKISSAIGNQLQRLVEIANNIKGEDFASLERLVTILGQLNQMNTVNTESLRSATTSLKQFTSATRSASNQGRKYNTVLANIRVRTLAMVRVTQMIVRSTTKAMSVYGDYVETLNLFKMAMGDAGNEAYAFAEKAQSLLGIDLTQWMKAQGVFNALASGFGVASDKAALMSQNLTQLAYDISSFYNIDVESAIEKVQSGFAGQIRPVRDLGYDLSQARLETIALSLGIDKSVKSMTQAEKSQLRYIALMTQLKQVQGDLARTLDSPTNQLRILNAQLEQMYRSIGLTLLPILNQVLPYLNAILRVIKMIAEEIAAMFGYSLPKLTGSNNAISGLSVDVEDLEDDLNDATGAAEKLKNTLASFDQINLITSKSGGSGGGSGSSTSGAGFDIDLPTYDFLGDATENKAQEIAEKMMSAWRPFIDLVEGVIKFVVDNLEWIETALLTLALYTLEKKLGGAIMDVWKWFNKLNDVVKGIGLITIGLVFSYEGGKNLAQGDIVEGLIESTLGTGLAAYGGYLLAGPAGLVAGLVLGVAVTYESYKSEKLEQMREKINNDFMTLFPDQMKITDLVDSWNHELGKIFEFNADEENSTVSTLKTNVDEIGTAIMQLQANYQAGTITGAAYASNLELMYADMEKSVKDHLEAVGRAIDEYLDGPFGRWMEINGKDVQGVKDNVKRVIENVAENLEKNRIELQKLNEQYELGLITESEYAKQSKVYVDSLADQYELLGLNSDATQEFLDKFDNLDINFEDWDTLQAKLAEIKEGYEKADESIDSNRESLKAYFAQMREEDVPEMRSYWEGLIRDADTFADEQKTLLRNNYQDLLESVESSAGLNWEHVYNKDGFENAMKFVGGHMSDLEETIAGMYSDAKLTRNKSFWSDLMGSVGDYAKIANASLGTSFNFDRISGEAKRIADDIRSRYDIAGRETNSVWEKAWDNMVDTATKGTKKIQKTEVTYATESNHTVSAWGYNYDVIVRKTYDDALRVVDSFKGKQKTSMQTAMSTVQQIISNTSAPEDMKRIMTRMQDAIKPEEFGLKATSLKDKFMTNFKKDFTPVQTVTDFKNKFAEMFEGDDAKKWGEQLGSSIKMGIGEGMDGAETGVNYALQGAKQVLDNFGYASAQYWAQMSNNIISVMSALMKNPSAFANKTVSFALEAIMKNMKWSMKGFASGGFPDTADFFYANENGVPEYVGSIGGRTAVATNNDIVKGVSDGVYRAIKSTGIQNDVKKLATRSTNVVFAPSAEAGRVMSQSVNLYNATGGRR